MFRGLSYSKKFEEILMNRLVHLGMEDDRCLNYIPWDKSTKIMYASRVCFFSLGHWGKYFFRAVRSRSNTRI